MVGSPYVSMFRAVDPACNYGFILCPDSETAQFLRAHYVTVSLEKIYFDVVSSVKLMPFDDDINQHRRVLKWI
uniref:Uncharacterized protein n=1 Tax=Setaria italica TaxID=4555 RepID=K3ZBG7_SETIT